MTEAESRLLSAVARAVLSGDAGTLEDQLDRPTPSPRGRGSGARAPRPRARPSRRTRRPRSTSRSSRTGTGAAGSRPTGASTRSCSNGTRRRRCPWANVLANPELRHASSPPPGPSYTWSENSRENRLTPFANDPVTESTGEAIYLRDDETRRDLGRDARADAARPPTAVAGSCATAPA